MATPTQLQKEANFFEVETCMVVRVSADESMSRVVRERFCSDKGTWLVTDGSPLELIVAFCLAPALVLVALSVAVVVVVVADSG